MKFYPRMLTLAREAEGMTQQELSDASGISQSVISKAENGVRDLGDGDLGRLANALRVTPALLQWPDDVHGFGSASFFHRKQQSLPQKTLKRIQGRINLFRMRLTRLTRALDIEPALALPRIDLDDVGGPAEVARRLRAAWRVPIGPMGSMVGYLEAAGLVVARRDFGTHRIDAISVWHPGTGPISVVNLNMSTDRQRFVLAHELGHLVMHEGQPPRDTAEREADNFAQELLMPERDIRDDLRDLDLRKALDLKPYWKVAAQALVLRAQSLGLMTTARSRSLHQYMNKLGYLKQEPIPLPREEPTLLPTIVRIHLEEHKYSSDELAAMLGMRAVDVEEEYLDEAHQQRLRIVK